VKAETVEKCLRCGTPMEWRHGTWQCPRCKLKLGCCEGQTGENCEP
jgi:DNA-directed RNA polymerase subunit RPC12/RpoP